MISGANDVSPYPEVVRLLGVYSAIDSRYNWIYRRTCRRIGGEAQHECLEAFTTSNLRLRAIQRAIGNAMFRAGRFVTADAAANHYHGILFYTGCTNQRRDFLNSLKDAIGDTIKLDFSNGFESES